MTASPHRPNFSDVSTQPMPLMDPTNPRVAIVGGGMAGLSCARALLEAGIAATVFEKSRGAGGRMSTRRCDDLHFDHGAQYFTVRHAAFDARVQSWLEAGVVAPWQGRLVGLPRPFSRTPTVVNRYVGIPGMSAVLRSFGEAIDVRYGTPISGLSYEHDHWWLESPSGPVDEIFAAVVCALPAPQAVPLLAAAPHLQEQVAAVDMAPTWAVMVTFETPFDVSFDGAFIDHSPLNWAARNDSKPGRSGKECWVLHSTADWSRQHLDSSKHEVTEALLEALVKSSNVELPKVLHLDAHRWLHARTAKPLAEICLFDPQMHLGICGDWCPGARVEGAYLSGLAVADRLIAQSSTLGPGQSSLGAPNHGPTATS